MVKAFDWVDLVSIELTTMMLATLFDFPFKNHRKLTRWSDVTTAEADSPIVGSQEQRISGSIMAFNEFPDQLDRLRASPELLNNMISEVVRWQTPLAHMRRTAVADCEVGGRMIRKGDKVVMWYYSGNRHESVFPDGDRFDIARPNARSTISFGFGIHRCLGMCLAEHRTGTTGDRRTAEWLVDVARAAGLPAELQGFPFQRRIVREAWVALAGLRIEGLPLFDGGQTGEPIEAPLRPLAHQPGIGVGLFSPAALDLPTREFVAARAAGRHQALIAVASGREVIPGLAVMNAENYADPFPTPVLQVATEHGERLLEAASQAELAPLVVMTPRSSWWVSTSERGGGIVVWVEALRRLAAKQPLRTVIFSANTGHELGHLGLDAWLALEPDLPRTAHAWVHLGANFAARGSELRFQASDQAMLDAGLAPDQVTPIGTRPFGEARDVFAGGGRFVSIQGTNRWFHHPDDRLESAVDVERTAAITEAMLEIVERLANDPQPAMISPPVRTRKK